ncbi:MAG: lytic transglycosylase domain-containing protein [Clostridia bacterium]|nr:lytic transglycosylase domain-containing protein [Clostridia bacterium]
MKRAKRAKNTLKFNIIVCGIIILLGIGFYIGYEKIWNENIIKNFYPLKYSEQVYEYADEYNLSKELVFGIIKTESNFKEDAVSSAGALGLMQITPDTFRWALLRDNNKTLSEKDIYTPEINIKYGCYIFRLFLDEFQVEETAIAAYNAGRGAVNKWLLDERYSKDGKTLYHIPYGETRHYVKKVMANKNKYKEIYDFSNK